MLILSSKLKNTPIMGLQAGTQLALASEPLINPANLQILAYQLEGPSLDNEVTLLRIADIRELSKLGFIIDSSDEFISPTDVIKINEIYNLNFQLLGMKVVDQKGSKLGTVADYTLSLANFIVQQLIIKRPLLKSFNDPELTVHRSQIIAIDDEKITIKNETEVVKDTQTVKAEDTFTPNYVNPFRG
jgi:sporulation protein YlmC with PRC-barrel domain